MPRPRCERCGGPLDIFPEPYDDGRYWWTCQTGRPIWTDEQFFALWATLPGDEVARLERWLMDRGKPPVTD